MISDFKYVHKIYQNDDALLYRAIHHETKEHVLIKASLQEYPSRAQINSFKKEADWGLRLAGLPILSFTYCIEKSPNRKPYLYTKNVDVLTLEEYRQNTPFEIKSFLELAISITKSIGIIHEEGVILQCLSPETILINLNTKEIFFSELHYATPFSVSLSNITLKALLEKAPAYISPEQTGRIGAQVDYRTDFYSLGMIFYKFLTGCFPFEGSDLLAWVHSHIAKEPKQPHEYNNGIPFILSSIVLKLLAKSPEERYQSTYGLLADLQFALEQWEQYQWIPTFSLGKKDMNTELSFNAKYFYGREDEKATLWRIFEKAGEGRTAEVILINGEQGIGKTALVKSVFAIEGKKENCLFLEGNFARGKDKTPYHPIIQAMNQLIHEILATGPKNVDWWKGRIEEALGKNVGIITDIIPELTLIVGEQKPIQWLPTIETENRFRTVFHNFIKLFQGQNQPLVLFLDDLEWIDSASVKWLKEVLEQQIFSRFLFIGSFTEDTNPSEELKDLLADVFTTEHTSVTTINLGPLRQEDLDEWLKALLSFPLEEKEELLALLYEKTSGNPQLFQKLLQSMYQKKIIYFHHQKGKWIWEQKKFHQLNIEGNLQDLLIRNYNSLTERAKKTLAVAACIGNPFSVDLIHKVVEFSKEEVEEYLGISLVEGLIIELGTHASLPNTLYSFTEDGLWRAIYERIEAHEKKRIHYNIGLLLLKKNKTEQKAPTYDVLRHVNFGVSMEVDLKKREMIAALNLEIGNRAKVAIAYKEALNYFQTGIHWLGSNSHLKEELYLQLSFGELECLYLLKDVHAAETKASELLERCKTNVDKAMVYYIKMRQSNHLEEPKKVTDYGLEGLKLLDFHFSTKSKKLALLIEWLKVKRKLTNLSTLPPLDKDVTPEIESIFNLLGNLGPAIYLFDSEMYGVYLLKMLNLNLKGYKHSSIAISITQYALFLTEGVGKLQEGYEIGRKGVELAEFFNDDYISGIVYMCYGAFVNHFGNSLQSSLSYLNDAARLNIDVGNFILGGGSITQILNISFMCGVPLPEFQQSLENEWKVLKELRMQEFQDYHSFYSSVISFLRIEKSNDGMYDKLYEDYLKYDKRYGKEAVGLYFSQLFMIFSIHIKKYDIAALVGEKIYKESEHNVVGVSIVDYWVYYSFALFKEKNGKDKKYKERVKRFFKKMKKWAVANPTNFSYRAYLLEAILLAWENQKEAAIKKLELALHEVETKHFVHHQAFIAEVLGEAYKERNNQFLAQKYLKIAYTNYKKWGATTLAEKVIQDHGIQVSISEEMQKPLDYTSSLNVISIIKASQILSKEIVLENVITRLLEIVLENAAAQRGILILEKNKELFIEAEATVQGEKNTIRMLKSIPLSEESCLPYSLIHYVKNIKEVVILDNLSAEQRFAKDKYVQSSQPKSVLTLPILNKGKLVGILYLENNLSYAAFTNQQVDTLKLLSTQVAISIENATLYTKMQELNDHLEEKVVERTKFLEQSQKETAEALAEKSVLEERNRIAREIHDVVGHTLTTTVVQIEASKRLFYKDPKTALEKVELAQDLIRKGLDDIRRSVRMLKVSGDTFDLHYEIENLLTETTKHTGINVKHEIKNIPVTLTSSLKKVIFHALQEGLTNGIKHGKGDTFIFQLDYRNNQLTFRLEDNGVGCDNLQFGFGLNSMRERIEELQGKLAIHSEKGKGTVIEIALPHRSN